MVGPRGGASPFKTLLSTSRNGKKQPNLGKIGGREPCNENADIQSVLAPVVQKEDSAIQGIKHCPVDNTIRLSNTYPLDSNLSGG